MPVKLSSSGGGSVTLDTPSTASNYTVTLPAATSTLIDTTSTQTLTNKTLTAAGSNSVEATSGPTSSQLAGNRNKIINGAMMIDQRNAGASVTPTDGAYTLDRWRVYQNVAGKFTVQQNAGSITPPIGYTNYLGCTSTSSYSVGATETFGVYQIIEGFNIADLGWGTASAKTVTLSAWVYSSLTGTFGGSINNNGWTRSYPFSYSIPVANTWTQISVSIPGDTTGTWVTNNGRGIVAGFSLGTGSTNSGTAGAWVAGEKESATGATSVVGTNGATFYITGVQLEKGATATPFENRLYGTELSLCQRYYTTVGGDSANQVITMLQAYSTTQTNGGTVPFPVKMRTAPTFTYSALSDIYLQGATSAAITPTALSTGAAEGSTMCGVIRATVASGLAAGNAVSVFTANTNARFNFSAEL